MAPISHLHGRPGTIGRVRAWQRLLSGLLLAGLLPMLSGCTNSDPGVKAAVTSTLPTSPTPASGSGQGVQRACTGAATATAGATLRPVADNPTPALPVTFTDSRGKAVTVTDASRILALDMSGSLATTVYALGMGSRLIGRDVSTGIPELAHLPLVTHNGHELNGEAILDLRPSLVMTDYGIGPLEVQMQIEESGIPVVIMSDQHSRDLISPQIKKVAEVLGVPDLGKQLADRVEADIVAAEARVAQLAPKTDAEKLRMAFLYMRGTAGVYYWFGEGSGADDLIEALGGVDAANEAGVTGMRPINAEGLVRADPDLFLMMTHGLDSVGGVPGLKKVPGIADTDAGENSCVVDMVDYQILSFGPLYPDTLNALATAIYEKAAPA